MRILFFTPRYAPHIGGVEKHLAEICAILQSRHHITIVTEQHETGLPEHEMLNGVEVWRMPARGKVKIWWWLLRHSALLWSNQIWHVHDVFFWVLPFRPIFFWKKIFMTFHGYEPPGPPLPKQIFWHQVAELLTEGNICVGDFHRTWYGVEPNLVTYGGVTQAAQNKTKKTGGIFVGRLAEDTGILTYIRAVEILRANKHAVQLDIFGDGPLRQACEKMVKDLELPVHFHGFTPDADLLFGQYEFAFAAQYLAILQAFVAGIPVIAYANSPMKQDYLLQTSFAEWIAVAENAQEVAKAVLTKKRVEKNAQTWAKQQTWEAVAAQYEKLWRQDD